MSDFIESNWISVKDRLPEKNGTYLCCKFDKYVDIIYFAKDFESLRDKEGWNCIEETPGFYESSNYEFEPDVYLLTSGITHWMPLPELPKED